MTSTAHSTRLSSYFRAAAGAQYRSPVFGLLYGSFILLAITAGFDKFADTLANWSGYLG